VQGEEFVNRLVSAGRGVFEQTGGCREGICEQTGGCREGSL